MNSKSIYKVPNGKLLKIFLDYDIKTKSIKKISVTGDFFAYPEEAIDIIEKNLIDAKIEKSILLDIIESTINENKIEFIGLNAEGLTQGILMCLK